MQKFRADLHIHTLLSPCADLEMTPKNIVDLSLKKGLQIIGITDHNSTKNALLVKKIASEKGLYVLTGAEVTTREEVHCLVFFDVKEQLQEFQKYIDQNSSRIPNPDGHFGYQPVIDENENITELISYYLPAALKKSIHEIQNKVYELEGIFIPAHIDRPANGLLSQLGFIPENLEFDALGVLKHSSVTYVQKHRNRKVNISFLTNSDAHHLSQIGEICSVLNMKEINFREIKMALNQVDGRFVETNENNL